MACPLPDPNDWKPIRPRKDLDAQDVFNNGVNYGNELKTILIRSMRAARYTASANMTAAEIQEYGFKEYNNDPEFRHIVDHTLEQIIAVLAIRRMTA